MITCRYGAVRRQFGKDKYDETSIMNYPSWQNRIFPYVAHGFMDNFGCRELNNQWRLNEHKILENDSQTREMHALISVMKAITTWDMVQSLEECRQACGGLGFSSYSRIPSMIQDLNVMVTWEGDNNVLLQ
jgi:acyl-CoA oxidase